MLRCETLCSLLDNMFSISDPSNHFLVLLWSVILQVLPLRVSQYFSSFQPAAVCCALQTFFELSLYSVKVLQIQEDRVLSQPVRSDSLSSQRL
jgi:hypothetical protein